MSHGRQSKVSVGQAAMGTSRGGGSRMSTQSGRHKQPDQTNLLSLQQVTQHNKSMQQLDESRSGKDEVSSWLDTQVEAPASSDSTTAFAETSDSMTDIPTVIVADSCNLRSQQVLLAGQGVLDSHDAHSRLALAQTRMNSDSYGNIMQAVQMNLNGRYKPLKHDDPAIRSIYLEDFGDFAEDLILPLSESKKSMSSLIGLNKVVERMSGGATKEVRSKQHVAAKVVQTPVQQGPPQIAEDVEEEEENKLEGDNATSAASPSTASMRFGGKKVNLAQLANLLKDRESTSSFASSSLSSSASQSTASETPSALGSLALMLKGKKGGAASQVASMMAMKKWRSGVTGGKEVFTMRMFAVDDTHYNFLTKNEEYLAIDVPMPLKITLFEEACPIIQELYKEYARVIGKNHQLTQNALKKWKEMMEWNKVIDEL